MEIVALTLVLLLFLVMLDLGSRFVVSGSVKVSDMTGFGQATVGFLFLALSTSLPELGVGIIAPLTEQSPVSVGNVLGSNVVNVCLILGSAVLLLALKKRGSVNTVPSFAKQELGSLYFGLFIASIIPLSLIFFTGASWLIGLILILIFTFYSYQLAKIRVPQERVNSFESKKTLPQYVFITFAGIFVVILSSNWVVQSAVAIATLTGVPRTFVGATIIAFGTSLPELSVTLRAFLKGQTALGLASIIGSGFVNTTLILGVTLFIPMVIGSPLAMNMLAFQGLIIFALISNLFLWYFLSMERLGWKEGAILLFIYFFFLANTLGFIQLSLQTT